MDGLRVKLNSAKYRYVVATTIVSVLAFVRSLVFMKTLDISALGQIALMQTLVMFVGFMQFGLINGAYVQYSARDREINLNIMKLMATGIILLVPIAIIVILFVLTLQIEMEIIWPVTLAIGLGAGIATLASNWLNNVLVAEGLLGQSSLINLGATFLSLLAAFLSSEQGLPMALLSVLLQPLVVALTVLVVNPDLRPKSFGIHLETFRLLLRIGMMPFLSGISVLAMQQVERWSIASVLGADSLGQFYIVLMYATFFGLIPAALSNIYFPQAKRAYFSHQTHLFRSLVRCHLRDLLLYFLGTLFATMFLMSWAIEVFLPKYLESKILIYYALPGLMLFTLRDTASLVLFSSGKMRPLLITGGLTLLLFCFGLFMLWAMDIFNLTSVLIVRMVSVLPGTIALLFVQRKQIKFFASL